MSVHVMSMGGWGGGVGQSFRCMSVFRANMLYLWISKVFFSVDVVYVIVKYRKFVKENCWYVAVIIVMVIFVIYNTIIVRIILLYIVSNISISMITTIAISTTTTITSTLTLSVSSSS